MFCLVTFFVCVMIAPWQRVVARIEFSSKQSLLSIGQDATLITSGGLSGILGTISLEQGATIQGSFLSFTDGILGDVAGGQVLISGAFSIDTTVPITEANLGNNSIRFLGNNNVILKQNTALTNTWNFMADSSVWGNFTLDLSNPNAQIIIGRNTTLSIISVLVQGFDLTKVVFTDMTSTLRIVGCSVSIDSDISCTTGNFIIEGSTQFILNQNDVLFADTTTFTVMPGSSCWLDNRGSSAPPLFSFVATDTSAASGIKLLTAIDNLLVRISTDQSEVSDQGVAALTGGMIQTLSITPTGSSSSSTTLTVTGTSAPINTAPPTVVNISASTTMTSQNQIVVNTNVSIQGTGNSLTFTNTGKAQVVVQPGQTVSFANMNLLRINQSTFSMDVNSTIQFDNNTVLEFVEDVIYDRGSFEIVGNKSQVLMRGLGGKKRITMTTSPEGYVSSFNIGSNTLILEDIEIIGLQHFKRTSTSLNGKLYDGKIILSGQSRINLTKDTDMHFLVRGELCKIALQANNLTITGQIRFDDEMDSTLHIGFSFSSDTEPLAFALGDGALLLSCQDGQCGVIMDNDIVTVINQTPNSFVTNGKSVLGGGIVNIQQNPICQETQGFSLLPGLELQSPLPFFINLIDTAPLSTTIGKSFFDEFVMRNQTFRVNLPSPTMVVRTAIVGRNLNRNVAIRPGGTIKGLQPSKTDPLTLTFLGNSAVETIIRRAGQVASIARDTTSSTTSTNNTDVIKSSDTIFVTGTQNYFKITGLLEIMGQIVMDDGSELIFEFDDSVDVPKAIKFLSNTGTPKINLPPTASIVFQGNGIVFFDNYMVCNFSGTPPGLQQSLGNGLFLDDRPSLIFRDYAQFVIDDPKIGNTFSGYGKVLFQDGAQMIIQAGSLSIGTDEGNLFDLVFDKNATMAIGLQDSSTAESYARMSLANGVFNLRYDRNSVLYIKNGSLLEIGLSQNVFTGGQLNTVLFDRGSQIISLSGGVLAFGQKSLSQTDNKNAVFSWNNLDSTVNAAGTVKMYTNGSTIPFISALMQNRTFDTDPNGLSTFEVFKTLIRETTLLLEASDFVDTTDNLTKLITTNDVIITLASGDVIRREGPETGNVYGTAASGQRFSISPSGAKTFYSS